MKDIDAQAPAIANTLAYDANKVRICCALPQMHRPSADSLVNAMEMPPMYAVPVKWHVFVNSVYICECLNAAEQGVAGFGNMYSWKKCVI